VKIAVIGAGRLGSRHLQALATLPYPLSLYVVYPSESSLEVARSRLGSAVSQCSRTAPYECDFSTSHGALPQDFDLCIVATAAGVRREPIQATLKQAKVRALVLEKILFPAIDDYAAISELLSTTDTLAWVNCNVRMIPFFRELEHVCGTGPVHSGVIGSRARLASNLIHHIDFVNYLTGAERFELDLSLMDDHLGDSKRHGYADWEGTCIVKFEDGSIHSHTSYDSGSLPIMLSVFSEDVRFIHRSAEGLSWKSTARDGWAWMEHETVFPMQSTMTTELATALLETGDCDLPSYALSARLHVTMLDAFRSELQRLNLVQRDVVPFT